MALELDILKIVCDKLDQIGIPYMLTGSFAGNFYAVPRMTRDIDLVIAMQKSKIDTFLETFQNDFFVDRGSIEDAIKHEGSFSIIHNDAIFKIDFIVLKISDYRQTEFQRKRLVQLDKASIWIVAPEDLIISKLYLSEVQINEARTLLQSIRDLDQEYMEHWIQKLELNFEMEKPKDNMSRKMREMIQVISPIERLKAGCSMYETSKTLVTLGILAENPGISKANLRKKLFLKLYGDDFDSVVREKILKHLECA